MWLSQFDLMNEAVRIVSAAKEQGIQLRMMGACAIKFHSPTYRYLYDKLGRELSDLDFVGYSKQEGIIGKFFLSQGYRMRPVTITTSFASRLIFIDDIRKKVVDVFLDKMEMCHTLNYRGRLEIDFPTVPLAELLLQKLQIFTLTQKDVKDCLVLLREHNTATNDDDSINVSYIAKIFANDWGFWYTATQNLQKIDSYMEKFLEGNDVEVVRHKVNELSSRIKDEPKSLGWKTRARIGTSTKWYRDVDTMEK